MRYYDTITSLPPIPKPGDAPLLSPSNLMEQLSAMPRLAELMRAIFERMALQVAHPLVESQWFDYFAALSDLGKRTKTPFLMQLADFELALMLQLESVRLAKTPALRQKVERIHVHSSACQADATQIVDRWSQNQNPLDAYFNLLTDRLDWVVRHGDWFSFSVNEFISYCAALMICVEAAVLQNQLPVSAMGFPAANDRWRWSKWS